MSRWKKLLGLGEKAADEVKTLARGAEHAEPALEEGAEAAAKATTKSDKPRVTLEDAQKAKEARIAKEAEEAALATKRAGGIGPVTDSLDALTPGRFKRDGLDERLTKLSSTAKENGLIDDTIIRAKGKALTPKQAEQALKDGLPITTKEMSTLKNSKQADFDKWESGVATKQAKNEALANGKGGSSTLVKGLAAATVAVGAVGVGIATVSPDGVGVFGKYGEAKVDKALTDTQVAAQQANNLSDLQSSGGIQTPQKAAGKGNGTGKVQEAELQVLVTENLKDYLVFANSKELDPKNVAPDLTPQQSTALMLALTNAQQKAREDTNESKKGVIGKAFSVVAGKDNTPITIDSSNMALFLDNFRKKADEELKDVSVPAATKAHLMTSLFDPNQQESVVSKLALKLDLTR